MAEMEAKDPPESPRKNVTMTRKNSIGAGSSTGIGTTSVHEKPSPTGINLYSILARRLSQNQITVSESTEQAANKQRRGSLKNQISLHEFACPE